jgi:hypothetical protein
MEEGACELGGTMSLTGCVSQERLADVAAVAVRLVEACGR